MMGLIESIFDIGYLALVIGLGLRLVFFKNREATLFGVMAILLGLGDAFHLVPRVLAHLTKDGFKLYESALSWGQFITGITMTIFYVMFYFYYRIKSGDKNDLKKWLIIGLAVFRVILIALPQNEWGTMPGNYTMGIVRNIPFLVMGILLIFWTYNNRERNGLERMYYLIFLSFLFYIPVVLFVDTIPVVGALMMPKTVAYVFIVVQGFKHYIKKFDASNVFEISMTLLIMGFIAGVFYREFTKYFSYTEANHLGKLHVHTLALGFIVAMLLYLLVKNFDSNRLISIKRPLYTYITGLIFTITTMTVFGIYDVVRNGEKTINIKALEGFSGMGHIILSVGLVYLLLKIKKLSFESN